MPRYIAAEPLENIAEHENPPRVSTDIELINAFASFFSLISLAQW
jgi:hypothetical protein